MPRPYTNDLMNGMLIAIRMGMCGIVPPLYSAGSTRLQSEPSTLPPLTKADPKHLEPVFATSLALGCLSPFPTWLLQRHISISPLGPVFATLEKKPGRDARRPEETRGDASITKFQICDECTFPPSSHIERGGTPRSWLPSDGACRYEPRCRSRVVHEVQGAARDHEQEGAPL